MAVSQDGLRRSAFELLSYPSVEWEMLQSLWPAIGQVPEAVRPQIEADARYAVYLDRQDADIARTRRELDCAIPAGLDYAAIPGLSRELRDKLAAARPMTLGQAQRLEGMTPAALTVLLAHVSRPASSRAA